MTAWSRLTAFALMCLCVAGPVCAANLFTGDEARPADAIVVFDGADLSGWVYAHNDEPAAWIVQDGYMEVKGGSIKTKQEFGDCQLHVEFRVPLVQGAKGEARGNSGVYLQASYEIQVLDSYGLEPGGGDCGAIYGVAPPLVNASRPPEHWQTYDVIFHAPTYDADGNKTADARMTVLHNNVLVQYETSVPSPTTSAMARDTTQKGPLYLQDHGHPVRFRNIWIRAL